MRAIGTRMIAGVGEKKAVRVGVSIMQTGVADEGSGRMMGPARHALERSQDTKQGKKGER